MADGNAPSPLDALTESQRRLIALGEQLWNDKSEKGRMFRETAKATYPAASIPEDQFEPILKPFRDEVTKLREELAEERKAKKDATDAAAQQQAERTLAQGLAAAVKRFNLTEEGQNLTIKRMQDTGNFTDPMAAAAWVVADNPPPKDPSGYLGPQAINLFGSAEESAEERIKLLHKDPMGKFLDAEFRDFVADPDQYVRDAGFAA